MKILFALFVFVPAFAILKAEEPDYSAFNRVLKRHVRAGKKTGIHAHLINYRALKGDADFTAALQTISAFDTAKLKTRAEKMAFYINAYNIAAIAKVLEKYPLASIRASGDGVWKETAIALAGKPYSLDGIENQVLRPMRDARIHFAIVCASLSCPDLHTEAYTAAKLQAQLEAQTRAFLANESKGLRIEGNRILQSEIFVWFKEDFGEVAAFQARYRKGLPASGERLQILYNWQLNE